MLMVTSTVSARDFRAHFTDAIDRARHGDATVVTRNGKPVGAFVPVEILNQWQELEERELIRIAMKRRDSPIVPMAEVLGETLSRSE